MLRATKWNRWIPITPTGKQLLFLSLTNFEAFFGGAARGGKSFALLAGGLQYVDEPGYSALILRSSLAELNLPGALMTVAHDWLYGTAAKWNDQRKTWTFPSGATLTFGYMDSRDDERRYLGSEYQYIAYDELTGFSESQYRYLFHRLTRRPGSVIPIRVRSASNPGGPGHGWVKERFIVGGAEDGRQFIPADLYDNVHVDQKAYLAAIGKQDIVTRAQMMGDWDILAEGNMFKRQWFEIVDAVPAGGPCVRFWDLAATEAKDGTDPDWAVGAKIRRASGIYFVEDVQRTQSTPQGVEALVLQTAMLDGPEVEIVMEQEPGSSGKTVIDHYRRVLGGFVFRGVPSTGSKELRAQPVSAQAEAGNVKLLKGLWIGDFLDELTAFPGGSHDDQVDGLSGGVCWLAAKGSGNAYVFSSSDGDADSPETIARQLDRLTKGAAPGGVDERDIEMPGAEDEDDDEPAGMHVVGYGQLGGHEDIPSIEEAQRLGADGEPVGT